MILAHDDLELKPGKYKISNQEISHKYFFVN